MARDTWRRGQDVPCFIPPGKEHLYPATGRGVDIVGFVPEGFSAEQVLNGEYAQAMKRQEEADAELAQKRRVKK